MKKILVAAALASLTACASQPITLVNNFNRNEVAWFNKPGDSKIIGQAFLRTNSGFVETCAGSEVSLIPVSTYAYERMDTIFGRSQKGYRPFFGAKVKFASTDPEYSAHQKQTTCDAQGNFEFERLPAGEYFVVTGVRWKANQYIYEGGLLMRRVAVATHDKEKIILTY